MTIIDCHTHLGRNEHINYSVEQLLHSMDNARIDKALVFAGQLNDAPNSFLLKEIPQYKDRLFGVASFHPWQSNDEDIAKLKGAVESGHIVAVKFYLGYDHWYPSDERIYQILEYLDGKNITAIFHCGDCLNTMKGAKLKYSHPLGIDEVAVDFPNQKIVMAHMAYPWHRDAAEVVFKNANVYTDISGFVYGDFSEKDEVYFKKVIGEFLEVAGGDSKMLFGTDAPISNQNSYMAVVRYQNILSKDVFEKNPKKAFNI